MTDAEIRAAAASILERSTLDDPSDEFLDDLARSLVAFLILQFFYVIRLLLAVAFIVVLVRAPV